MVPLFPVLLAFVSGILLSPCLDPHPVWLCLPLAVLLTFARRMCALLAMLLLGAGLRSLEPPVPPDPPDEPVRLIGCLIRGPEWRGLGTYLDVELQTLDEQPYRGRARLKEFLDDPELRRMFEALDLGSGDRLEILVKLHRPVIYRNPGVFDFRRHLERQGVYWTGTIRNPRLIRVLERGWHGTDRLKNWIQARLQAPFETDRTSYRTIQGLVMGMVLGRKHGIPAEVERQFQAGGLYHLVVVSGFNLAVVAGTAHWLARRIRWKRRSRLLFVLLCTLAYAALAEGQAPVLRAMLMVCFLVFGRLLDRGYAVTNAICGTALIILLIDPTAIEDPSFQMSFAAVLSVVGMGVPAAQWSLGWLREALRDFRNAKKDGDLPVKIAEWRVCRRLWCELHGLPFWAVTVPWKLALVVGEMAAVSISVEIVFVIFMVESFHRISPLSPLLNIPAGLIAAAVTPLGLLLIVLPWPVTVLAGWLIGILLKALLAILSAALALPAATFRVPSVPVWLWLVYGISVVILVAAVWKRWRVVCLTSLAFILIFQSVMSFGNFAPFPPKDVTLTFLDVGQGDSALVEFPDGRRMLVDGGGVAAGQFLALRDESTFSIGEDVVSPYLFSRRIRRLDTVVLTHAHHDHMDGLFDIIENFAVGEFWMGRNPMIPRYRALIERLQERRIPIRWVTAGQTIGDIRVLHPPANWAIRKTAQNDDSVVLLLTTAHGTALLTGDVERRIPVPERVDVLKVPHHGSKGVRLKVAAPIRVISVGASNPFGHPHPSALPALRTDRLGAITVTLGGGGPHVATALTNSCQSCKLALLCGATKNQDLKPAVFSGF